LDRYQKENNSFLQNIYEDGFETKPQIPFYDNITKVNAAEANKVTTIK
jgi:hypothetical protein